MLGRRPHPDGDEYCVASEDCAFGPIGFERVRDVAPGEMIIITPEGKLISRQCAKVRRSVLWCGRMQQRARSCCCVNACMHAGSGAGCCAPCCLCTAR